MDELDHKLSLIIEGIQEPSVRNRVLREGELTYLEEIEQAFIDAGWTPKDVAEKSIKTYHVYPAFTKGINSELMTGQEWYDRFISQLEADLDNAMIFSREIVRKSAKKAAGIK